MERKLWHLGGKLIVIKYSAGKRKSPQIHIAGAAQPPPRDGNLNCYFARVDRLAEFLKTPRGECLET